MTGATTTTAAAAAVGGLHGDTHHEVNRHDLNHALVNYFERKILRVILLFALCVAFVCHDPVDGDRGGPPKSLGLPETTRTSLERVVG